MDQLLFTEADFCGSLGIFEHEALTKKLGGVKEVREKLYGGVEEGLKVMTVEDRFHWRIAGASAYPGVEVSQGGRGAIGDLLGVNPCLGQALHRLGYVARVLEAMLKPDHPLGGLHHKNLGAIRLTLHVHRRLAELPRGVAAPAKHSAGVCQSHREVCAG